jgi:hypothetical protein
MVSEQRLGPIVLKRLRSQGLRQVNFQGDALRLGMNWTEEDLGKPQILVESAYGMGHPGTFHFRGLVEEVSNGVFEAGGKPAEFAVSDIRTAPRWVRRGKGRLRPRDGDRRCAHNVQLHCTYLKTPHRLLVGDFTLSWESLHLATDPDQRIPVLMGGMATTAPQGCSDDRASWSGSRSRRGHLDAAG